MLKNNPVCWYGKENFMVWDIFPQICNYPEPEELKDLFTPYKENLIYPKPGQWLCGKISGKSKILLHLLHGSIQPLKIFI